MKVASRGFVALACVTGVFAIGSRTCAQEADIVSEVAPTGVEGVPAELELDAPAELELQPASPEERSHLNVWIEYLGRSARKTRLTSGSTLLIVGSIVTAVGVAFYVSSPVSELDKGLGLAFVGIGGIYTALGITWLAKKSAGEKLLADWTAAKNGTLTLRELARFEGELRGYSRLAARATRVSRWTSFGMGMTGVLILGLTPAADLSSDASTTGYAIGGILAGVGLLSFGFSFIKSANVDYWAAYQRGQRPPRANWSAAPSFGRSHAGLSVIGRF